MADPADDRVDLHAIAAGFGVIGAGIAIALVAAWLVIARSPAPARAPNDAARPAIAAVGQSTAPAAELAAYRREKMQRLETDGVDPATGEAHISIAHAMELLVARKPPSEKITR